MGRVGQRIVCFKKTVEGGVSSKTLHSLTSTFPLLQLHPVTVTHFISLKTSVWNMLLTFSVVKLRPL